MQLEEAYVVEITKLVECVDSKGDALMQIVRRHQHNMNSAVLHASGRLKTEVHRGTRQIKDNIAEKMKKGGEGGGCMNNCHVTCMKSWSIMNSEIDD